MTDSDLTPPSLPIVEHLAVPIEAAERRALARIAARLLADEPALGASAQAFGAGVSVGLGAGPSFLLQDLSGVALVAEPADLLLQYRMLLLAQDGDQIALSVRRSAAFETYCREDLKLGQVEVLSPALTDPRQSLATHCRQDRHVLAKLVELARHQGQLNIKPYLSTGPVWALAGEIAARSGATVRVAAPPPRLARRVNDKLWFSRQATAVLGEDSIPPSYSAFGPTALAERVASLVRQYDRVAIKVPNSSGSLGNLTLGSAALRQLSVRALQEQLLGLLRRLGWRDTYPLLVSVWECPVVVTPSVQLWIPAKAHGLPVVEGVFDQIVEGPVGAFIGVMPSTLPDPWCRRLAGEAARLGYLFQELGYFGRCSFDAILTGDDLDSASLHWIECNGRWGGTSIPMTLANRLVGDWHRRPFVVVQRSQPPGPPQNFATLVACLTDKLFRPGQSAEGVVFLLPGRFELGIGLDFMVLSETLVAARAEAAAVTALLTHTAERP